MNSKMNFKAIMTMFVLVMVVFSMRISTSFAAGTYTAYLVAREFTQTMPDGTDVIMWGFFEDSDLNLSTYCGETPTVPGPLITVPSNKTRLRIYLRNDLEVPVSLMIPGLKQKRGKAPKKVADDTGRMRVHSFRKETQPGKKGSYLWDVRPGTFIYHSASHPAVQVQMGLYGGVKKDYKYKSQVYKKVPKRHHTEAVFFFSEVDPALHHAVATNKYGTPDYPSTLNYNPKHFLINGGNAKPYLVGGKNTKVLLRLFNVGLESRVPTLLGPNWDEIAENGYPYTYSKKDQYSTLLTAMKTKDVILTIPESARRGDKYPLFDRMLGLNHNAGLVNNITDDDDINDPESGMLTYLQVGRPEESDLWPWGAPKKGRHVPYAGGCKRI